MTRFAVGTSRVGSPAVIEYRDDHPVRVCIVDHQLKPGQTLEGQARMLQLLCDGAPEIEWNAPMVAA